MKHRKRRGHLPATDNDICLGIVVVTAHQKRDEAIDQIRAHGAMELGTPQGNRLPGCIVTKHGLDRDCIAEIEALPAVLNVEVAFAQVIEADETSDIEVVEEAV